jgi:DNA-directed RNA polymerase specialized sigma24 family protein
MKKQKQNQKKKKIKTTSNNKVDEQTLLNVIDIITKKLAYKFKFGYHDIEDMRQQISIFAIEGLKNYDHKRPLENFLWTHVRNRLFNYKRDNYQRPDKPCLSCPLYDPTMKESFSGCIKFTNKNDCDLYESWSKRNSSKKNLMHLTTIDEVKNYSNVFAPSSDDYSILSDTGNQEIIRILDEKLTDEYRTIYLRLKNGSKINKADQIKLYNKIKEILGDVSNG